MKRAALLPLLILAGALLMYATGRDETETHRSDERPAASREGMGPGEGEASATPDPSAMRRVLVTVRDGESKDPMPGATVGLVDEDGNRNEVPEVLTDEHGEAVLEAPAAQFTTGIWALAPGEVRQPPRLRDFSALDDNATEMEIELERLETIRFLVVSGAPPDGTRISLVPRPDHPWDLHPPPFAVMEGRWLVVPHWRRGMDAHALGPNETIAALEERDTSAIGKETEFVRRRFVEVRLADASGRGASGVRVGVGHWGSQCDFTRETDAEGRVRIGPLSDDFVNLTVVHDRNGEVIEWIGRVDLRAHDVRIEHTLTPLHELQVHVTGDLTRVDPRGIGLQGLVDESVRLDTATGLLTGWVLPPPGEKALHLRAWRDGDLLLEAELEVPAPNRVWKRQVAVDPSLSLGWVEVHVQGKVDPWFRVVGGFELAAVENGQPGRAFTMRPIESPRRYCPPGRYFIRLRRTGIVIADVVVRANETTRVEVDARRLEFLECLVLFPRGHTATGAHVRIEGVSPGNGIRFERYLNRIDGNVQFGYVLSDTRYRLRVEHPTLAPDPVQGQYEGVGGSRSIELRLREGPCARFRVPPKYGAMKFVLVYPGEIDRREPLELHSTRDGEGWRLSGYLSGTYTLWCMAEFAAPLVLPNVRLGEDSADLGVLPFRVGSTLTIRTRVDEPFVAPCIGVAIKRLDPPFLREVKLESETGELVVPHLGAGRYELTIDCATRFESRTVTIDGEKDEEVVVDLRRAKPR